LSEVGWIAIASIASTVAVILSAISLMLQSKQYKNANDPLLTPVLKKIETELPMIGYDWETKEKIDGKFSETTIPILNIGGGLAYDINYNFELQNYREIRREIDSFKMFEKNYFKIECTNYEEHKYKIFVVEGESMRWFTKNQRYIRMINPLKSGEETEIPLPSYFIVLTNALLRYGNVFGFRNTDILPELILNINYKSINDKVKNKRYIIKWSGRQHTKNISYKYAPEQYFDSDIISVSIK